MDAQHFSVARRNMVDSQLKPNKVIDPRLLKAMGAVSREAFVPGSHRSVAYIDEDIPLGGGRFLMEPMVLARLLQAAEVAPSEVVLNVGCGTGYAAAVLSELGATVIALEADAGLAGQAGEALRGQGFDAVVVVSGPFADGYAKHAPYDVILLEGMVDAVPQALLDQLAEGGRLLAVVAEAELGKACLFARHEGRIGRRVLFDAAVPRLPGFQRAPRFVF